MKRQFTKVRRKILKSYSMSSLRDTLYHFQKQTLYKKELSCAYSAATSSPFLKMGSTLAPSGVRQYLISFSRPNLAKRL
ncbi:hypothetical protein C7475_102781 [Chitinophaga sp. S165]|nr:hypothetical protein C7475_102781 [Chitinophaga sp. S165]